MKLVNLGEPGRFLPRGGQEGDPPLPGQQPHTGELYPHMLYLPPPQSRKLYIDDYDQLASDSSTSLSYKRQGLVAGAGNPENPEMSGKIRKTELEENGNKVKLIS